jgi:predicted phosphate transport protein (TIGR00153 family)
MLGNLPLPSHSAPVGTGAYTPAPVSRLSQIFVPKDREFFDLFEEASSNVVRAAELLDEMLRGFPERKDLARDILLAEQEGDRITHDIYSRLNQTFVTPIDREDIIELASALDDVVDLIEEAADLLVLYKIEAPMEQAEQLAHILRDSSRQVAEAMPRMRGFQDISHYTVEIHRLENDGDRTVREATASLFDTGVDPMVVIRWKDIFDRLEGAIDATEHVADVLEGIVIKNS